MMKRIAIAVSAICVLCTNMALADNTSTFSETQSPDSQQVYFKDDPLSAGGFSATDAHITVIGTPKRVMLLRPRTQFVTELLKTVENL